MLRDNDIAILSVWTQAIVEFDAPAALFEYLVRFDPGKRGVHHGPALHAVIVRLLVQTVEHGDLLATSDVQQLVQVRDGVRLLETVADHGIELAILVQKFFVGIDQNDCSAFVTHLDSLIVVDSSGIWCEEVV